MRVLQNPYLDHEHLNRSLVSDEKMALCLYPPAGVPGYRS